MQPIDLEQEKKDILNKYKSLLRACADKTNKEDKKFSLTGLAIRLTDKISRLKNLLLNGKNFVQGEGMEDTFIDIANYGIIGLLVGRNKWKK